MQDKDPTARWHALPDLDDPSTWVTETDPDPVPGSIEAADADQVVRDVVFGPGG